MTPRENTKLTSHLSSSNPSTLTLGASSVPNTHDSTPLACASSIPGSITITYGLVPSVSDHPNRPVSPVIHPTSTTPISEPQSCATTSRDNTEMTLHSKITVSTLNSLTSSDPLDFLDQSPSQSHSHLMGKRKLEDEESEGEDAGIRHRAKSHKQ